MYINTYLHHYNIYIYNYNNYIVYIYDYSIIHLQNNIIVTVINAEAEALHAPIELHIYVRKLNVNQI